MTDGLYAGRPWKPDVAARIVERQSKLIESDVIDREHIASKLSGPSRDQSSDRIIVVHVDGEDGEILLRSGVDELRDGVPVGQSLCTYNGAKNSPAKLQECGPFVAPRPVRNSGIWSKYRPHWNQGFWYEIPGLLQAAAPRGCCDVRHFQP